MEHVIYECGICSCYHPWGWDGDCRDDGNRFDSLEDYASAHRVTVYEVEVRSMEERVKAD